MTIFSEWKLGRKAVKTDTRTLKLARYLNASLPSAPPAADWTRGTTEWGTMLNDKLGDCTIAGVAHAVQVWTLNAQKEQTVADKTVLRYYQRWDGYDPKNPATDQGGIELDVLKNWKQSSFNGHKLLAFADPDTHNLEEVRQSIHLFGGLYIGLNLPRTAQNQDLWDVVPNADSNPDAAPGSWGGHCVFVPKYDAGTFTAITWGQLKPMTPAFWLKYCDEVHALLSNDWFNAQGSPTGFNQQQLLADLALIQ